MTTTQNQKATEKSNAEVALIDLPEQEVPVAAIQVYGLKFENRVGVFTVRSENKYNLGDRLIVKTDRGKELCFVKYIDLNKELDRKKELDITEIIRVVNENDEATIKRNTDKQKSALEIARSKVEALKLQMKISSVEYLFDSSRIIFYFLAPRKVDFRELVRLLASEFKTRIELRQITSRQNVSMKGAVGACGRETCCSSFLTRTPVVSMDMVETQRLSKNPAKLNGVCGKLKCCLSYENNFYEEASKGIPTRGSCVKCKSGKKGKVCGINVFTEEMTIYVDDEATYENINFSDILSEEEAKKRDQEERLKKEANHAKKANKDSKNTQQGHKQSQGNKKNTKASHKKADSEHKKNATKDENKQNNSDNKSAKKKVSNSKSISEPKPNPNSKKADKPLDTAAQNSDQEKPKSKNKSRRNRKKSPKKASNLNESSPTSK